METFTSRLNEAMNLRNIRAAELSRLTGLSKARISQYTNGIYEAKQVALYKIALALDVSEAWLMGYDVPMERRPAVSTAPKLSSDKMELLSKYDMLNTEGRAKARERVDELTMIPQYRNSIGGKPAIRTIPFDAYIMKCSAGTGLYLFENAPEKVNVVESPEAIQSDFIVPVSGNSMEPKFKDGSHVFVKAMPRIQQGEVGIFVKNGEAYIKVLGDRTLISINADYSPIEIKDGDNVVCVGKVMGTAEVV